VSPIRIDKSFPVSNVIITPDSVRALVKIILSASKELPPQKPYYQQRFTFAATSSDGMQYSSETPELFQNDGELDTKQIERIAISFRDSTNEGGWPGPPASCSNGIRPDALRRLVPACTATALTRT
jgi:hypothetical protein